MADKKQQPEQAPPPLATGPGDNPANKSAPQQGGAGPVGHHSTFPYPGLEHLQESLPVVMAKIRGEEVDRNDLIHCGYVVEGFALGQVFPHRTPMGAAAEPRGQTKSDLEELAAQAEGGGAKGAKAQRQPAGALNWMAIAAFVAQMLQQWLNNRDAG